MQLKKKRRNIKLIPVTCRPTKYDQSAFSVRTWTIYRPDDTVQYSSRGLDALEDAPKKEQLKQS